MVLTGSAFVNQFGMLESLPHMGLSWSSLRTGIR